MAVLARFRWIGLLFISLAISIVIIDGTIVNTIFPALIEALDLSSSEVQWVNESYVLCLYGDLWLTALAAEDS